MIAPNPDYQSQAEAVERLDLDTRVNLSIAFGSYVNAEREFNRTSRRFTEACKDLRKQLPAKKRLVIRHDSTHYLVETDDDGNFDIEVIESL
ncbi:MAG: hypothetical protein ACE361_25330 [Aureliella sp.]